MVKVIFTILAILITGCTSVPVVQTKLVNTPTLFCPAPPENPRPTLWTDHIGQDEDLGNAVVKYKATIRALLDYAERQERIIQMYQDLSKTSGPIGK
jgi:hypothetical protein